MAFRKILLEPLNEQTKKALKYSIWVPSGLWVLFIGVFTVGAGVLTEWLIFSGVLSVIISIFIFLPGFWLLAKSSWTHLVQCVFSGFLIAAIPTFFLSLSDPMAISFGNLVHGVIFVVCGAIGGFAFWYIAFHTTSEK